MRYKLNISPLVLEDLYAISEYIEDEFIDKKAAIKITKQIYKKLNYLSDNPFIGQILDIQLEVKLNYRYLVCKNYL